MHLLDMTRIRKHWEEGGKSFNTACGNRFVGAFQRRDRRNISSDAYVGSDLKRFANSTLGWAIFSQTSEEQSLWRTVQQWS